MCRRDTGRLGCDQGRWRKIGTPEETRPLRTEAGAQGGLHLCTGPTAPECCSQSPLSPGWGWCLGRGAGGRGSCLLHRVPVLPPQPETILPPLSHRGIFSTNSVSWSCTPRSPGPSARLQAWAMQVRRQRKCGGPHLCPCSSPSPGNISLKLVSRDHCG